MPAFAGKWQSEGVNLGSWAAELVLLTTTLFDSPMGFSFFFFFSYQIGIFSGEKKMVLLAKVEIFLCTLSPDSFSKILMKFIRRPIDFVSQEDNYRNNIYGLSSLTELSL